MPAGARYQRASSGARACDRPIIPTSRSSCGRRIRCGPTARSRWRQRAQPRLAERSWITASRTVASPSAHPERAERGDVLEERKHPQANRGSDQWASFQAKSVKSQLAADFAVVATGREDKARFATEREREDKERADIRTEATKLQTESRARQARRTGSSETLPKDLCD